MPPGLANDHSFASKPNQPSVSVCSKSPSAKFRIEARVVGVALYRAITLNGYAMHDAPLTVVVVNGVVLGAAVVPNRH
jgi:hypothetical protein